MRKVLGLLAMSLLGWAVLYAQHTPPSAGNGPAGAMFDRQGYYTVKEKDKTIGDGYIQIEKRAKTSDAPERLVKNMRFELGEIRERFSINMTTATNGNPLVFSYQAESDDKVFDNFDLTYEGSSVAYSIKSKIGSFNGSVAVGDVYPLDLFLNEHVRNIGRWENGYLFTLHKFNPVTMRVDAARYTLVKDEVPHNVAREGVDTYTLTLGEGLSLDDYSYAIRSMTIDKEGLIYEIVLHTRGKEGKHEFVIELTPSVTDESKDYTYYDLNVGADKIGWGFVAAENKLAGTRDALQLATTEKLIVNSNLTRVESQSLFDKQGLQLINLSQKVYIKSPLALQIMGEVKDDKLELKWEVYAPEKKKGSMTLDVPVNSVYIEAFTEYFKYFDLQQGIKYTFWLLEPSPDESRPFVVSTLQFTCGMSKPYEYYGKSIKVYELKAPYRGGQIKAYVAEDGALHELEVLYNSETLVTRRKVTKEDAEDFKPSKWLSYEDDSGHMIFKMGFRRDPFTPPPKEIIQSETSDAPGRAYEEENAIYLQIKDMYMELERALESNDLERATRLFLEIDNMTRQNFDWESVRALVAAIRRQVEELKGTHREVLARIEDLKRQKVVESAENFLSLIKEYFEDEEYQLVFTNYEQLQTFLKSQETLLKGNLEFKALADQVLESAKKYHERATAITEFATNQDKIRITGIIVEEGNQVAVINNKAVVAPGDEVMAFRTDEGDYLGTVFVESIDTYGVTFKYKGELITKTMDEQAAGGSVKTPGKTGK